MVKSSVVAAETEVSSICDGDSAYVSSYPPASAAVPSSRLHSGIRSCATAATVAHAMTTRKTATARPLELSGRRSARAA
ncbi:hypothetical protein D4739_12845 [Nocardioides cavernaquae]|uniref:Uncharacterized protein n=1 Tax=Nocardioides cavernaquae TaxID=2321396 RepID=A0A3A5H8R2_9ACTN|nr:hypothetical protein D4739_12845 [Nocardioides cavernaquae]